MLEHAGQIRSIIVQKGLTLPLVSVDAAIIYRTESIEGVDTNFIQCKPDHWTDRLVERENSLGFCACSSLPPYPYWKKWSCEMGIRDFGQRWGDGLKNKLPVD